MPTVLCYGDSNTWGDPPGGDGRYPWDVRWPGVLQKYLGDGFRVVEEGLCGRTTCFDDPLWQHRSGLAYLPVALESHYPIDLLVIMLGTNDLKTSLNLSASDIARGAAQLLVTAKNFRPAIRDVMLVSPPHVVSTGDVEIAQQFLDCAEKSRSLSVHYQRVADLNNCHFFDAATVARASSIDGIHLDAGNHRRLAEGLAGKILSITRS